MTKREESCGAKALIVGAAGFVGGYLAEHLSLGLGWKVYATKLPHESMEAANIAECYSLDILQPEQIATVLEAVQPQYIFHLAAQSSVGLSWKKPAFTVDVNINGAVNLLEAVRQMPVQPRVVLVGSSEEYGFLQPGEIPVKENTLPRPGNIYAVTKCAQNQLAMVYAKAYGLQLVATRSFNHIGPKQATGFVVPDFCKQIAAIEAGQQPPIIYVGNLEAKRDFCDVRDIVAAYGLLAQHGAEGETYNVGSGKAVSIQYILDTALSFAKKPIKVEQDPNRMRPSDIPEIRADILKISAAIGWRPSLSIEDTVLETLNHWRMKAKGS